MNDREVCVPLTNRGTENGRKDPPQEKTDVIVQCCASPRPLREGNEDVSEIARQLEYRVADIPPLHLSFLYGLQVLKTACVLLTHIHIYHLL